MSVGSADIRPPTRGDLPEVVDLLNTIDVAEIGRPDSTAEDLESDWGEAGLDLARDAWLALGPDGVPTGYAYAGDQFRTGELEGDVFVHPGGGEPGLASRLLDLVERRAAEIAAERGYPEPRLSIFAFGRNAAKRALLEEAGYALGRRVLRMAADLDETSPCLEPPDGVEIRPFRPGVDERTMRDVMSESFADHFRQSEEPFEAWRRRLVEHPDFDPGLWSLAWAAAGAEDEIGEQAVGGVIAYDHGDLGWVKGLGVLRPWRQRGVGGALLSHVFAALRARGQTRVELGVDADAATRALEVYERAGMNVAHEYLLYQRKLPRDRRLS
ncbi:MAG: GNAT family N-acetyltransferase [Thermoleophilia bacterium]|nr:GNAT family N-acetyltransferase [Thermoleophilia bacterium]